MASAAAVSTPSAAPAAPAEGQTITTPAAGGHEGAKPDGAQATDGGVLGAVDDQGSNGDKGKPGQSTQPSEIEIKLPEGMDYDAEALGEFKELAKKHGMTGEQATEIVKWEIERQKQIATKQDESWKAQGEKWLAEIKQDADFGGPKWEATQAEARRALRVYGGKEAADAFATLELGNHPAFVKMMARIGRAIKEDDSSTVADAQSGGSDQTQQLREQYPSMFKEDGSPK